MEEYVSSTGLVRKIETGNAIYTLTVTLFLSQKSYRIPMQFSLSLCKPVTT